MSLRYKGAVISATPPTTTGGNSGTAPGAWTLQQQLQAQAAGNWPNQPVWYIEDVFSTYLYTGNNTSQTVTNGIDLAGKGGLVWIKSRAGTYVRENYLYDTARGTILSLSTDTTGGNSNNTPNGVSAYNANGFTIVGSAGSGGNGTGTTYASWTFRKQPKFFDVVTYTGTGSTQTINHNLGSVPGCIIVKSTSTTTNWCVYHNGLGGPNYTVRLNTTDAKTLSSTQFAGYNPTATDFKVGTATETNSNGQTYVAYLFAHNAGGFGLTGTDNVISCGSFTVSGTTEITLNYEPQYVMLKRTDQTSDWLIVDSMRGFVMSANDQTLSANTAAAETSTSCIAPSSTGFTVPSGFLPASSTWIYIAIRRGPMKTPTTGTSVLGLNARTGTGANATVTGGAGVTDLAIIKNRGAATNWVWTPRLAGTGYLSSNATTAETAAGTTILQANPWDVMDGVKVGTTSNLTNASANTFVNYLIDRAPGFMDVVCYTGTGSATTVTHNLGAVPELMIVKGRSTASAWEVYHVSTGASYFLELNYDTGVQGPYSPGPWNGTTPTSTVFSLPGTGWQTNNSGVTYVAYLFATLAGVSKVGSYTGTGTTLQVNCGFTGGARFVMIKRTDSTGDWYVWDSARGIVAGNDPYLLLNSTAAEVTNTDYVDAYAAGFEISSTAPAAINANGGTFIFLAVS